MIVAIHQPNFMPWLGWFAKAAASDVFILLDDVPFSKRSYTSRVQMNSARGPWWATVPVKSADAFAQLINVVELVDDESWRRKMIRRIAHDYGSSELVPRLLERPERRLADYNTAIIRELFSLLEIHTEVRVASELNTAGHATEKLIALVKKVGGTTYLAGTGAKSYHDEARFAEEGIALTYRTASAPPYSVLDSLLTVGVEETKRMIAALSA